ncbi:hypothetical protein MOMUL_10590 [Moorella mulderi DSM 14980]|uniref:Uncharacterized protein n=1 Tax=Moorella mulderi DSM 14980 TaxID=1122241 RepID=A0A151AXT4_9FIRM|nr:hypothetical protein MOMUL_10590 [Moorella mulderi DSM 14980]
MTGGRICISPKIAFYLFFIIGCTCQAETVVGIFCLPSLPLELYKQVRTLYVGRDGHHLGYAVRQPGVEYLGPDFRLLPGSWRGKPDIRQEPAILVPLDNVQRKG